MPEIGRRMGITKQAVHQLLTPRRRSDARQLTEALILQLADEHHRATGQWPHARSGEVKSREGVRWSHLDGALRSGYHGLPGGSSLARLLVKYRGVGERRGRPPKPTGGEHKAPLRPRKAACVQGDFRTAKIPPDAAAGQGTKGKPKGVMKGTGK
jgi:hypothetical protein